MIFTLRPLNLFSRFLTGTVTAIAALGTLPTIVTAENPPIADTMILAQQECAPSMGGRIELRYYEIDQENTNDEHLYESILEMNGCTGKMLTTFLDQNNQTQTVEQRIVLTSTEHGLVWVGEDPVYPGTQTLFPNYSADKITLRLRPNGLWQVVNCNNGRVCSLARVIEQVLQPAQ